MIRLAVITLSAIILCGCISVPHKEQLQQDIEILKLEVRKQRLENELRDLEIRKD